MTDIVKSSLNHNPNVHVLPPNREGLPQLETAGSQVFSTPLGHAADADGRWRIYAFGRRNDGSNAGSEIHKLADWLESSPDSPVVKYTRKDEDIDALIDLRAVFQQTFDQLAYEEMPALLKPTTGKLGLQNHEKVFCTDHKGEGDFFDMRGVDRERGSMIVVRPDQYIAHVLPLDAYQELSEFFDGIFLPADEG